MLGEFGGTNNVGNSRESSISSASIEVIEGLADESLLVKRAVFGGGLILCEPGEWVVIEVISILEERPRNIVSFVDLRSSLPAKRIAVEATGFTTGGLIVIDVWPSTVSRVVLLGSRGIDGTRCPGDTVGVG